MAKVKSAILVNITNYVDTQLVGAGVFTRNVLSNWLKSETIDVTILHSRAIDAKTLFQIPDNAQVSFRSLNATNFFFRILFEQFILPFQLRRYRVYLATNPSYLFLARLICPDTKMIITIHDMIPFYMPEKYGWLRTKYVKWISKQGARYAHHVITVSENSKEDICKISDVAPSKITVVYNFMPFRWQNYTEDERYFLAISTIEPGKNIEGTLEAFRLFIDKYNNTTQKFYWAGKVGWGYASDQLNELIAKFNLDGRFILLGFIDDNQKADLLKKCTALVYLSHYEGFGLPVLEALLYNKPVVVTNVSSLPEVAGKAGVWCEPGNPEAVADALYLISKEKMSFLKQIPAQLTKFNQAEQIQKFSRAVSECLHNKHQSDAK